MKLVQADTVLMSEALNPKGRLAKDLEISAKKASWLSLVCSHWLVFKGGDAWRARIDEPTYNLPKAFKDAARFNKARKECGAWEIEKPRVPTLRYTIRKDGVGVWKRSGKLLSNQESVPVAQPSWSARWVWPDVFDYWYTGRLDAAVENLRMMLPETNQLTIDRELLK